MELWIGEKVIFCSLNEAQEKKSIIGELSTGPAYSDTNKNLGQCANENPIFLNSNRACICTDCKNILVNKISPI